MTKRMPQKDAFPKSWEEMTSREYCSQYPHFMAMMGYLSTHHGIPRYAYGKTGIVYHYTDAAGLCGIVSKNRLWATDIEFLNDPSEGKFLPPNFIGCMAGVATSEQQLRIVNAITSELEKPNPHRAMSVSFCDSGDLLSQWRGYGSFGGGYALGFDLAEPINPQIGLMFEVTYGRGEIEKVASDMLEIYTAAVESGRWDLDDIAREALSVLNGISSTFKDPSYSEERETRIVVPYATISKNKGFMQQESPLSFRARGPDVVPYMPISWDLITGDTIPKLPLKRVVTGPGVDFKRNRFSLSAFLAKNGYENVEIVGSEIPFRP